MDSNGFVVWNEQLNRPVTSIQASKQDAVEEWFSTITVESFLNTLDDFSLVEVEYDDTCLEPIDDGVPMRKYLGR